MVINGSLVGQSVLLLLLLMSSVSWAIIVLKSLEFSRILTSNQAFSQIFQTETRLDRIYSATEEYGTSSFAHLYRSAYQEISQLRKRLLGETEAVVVNTEMQTYIKDRLERVLQKTFNQQLALTESRLSVLASISSAAPFVGLFGTVLGIIDSFHSIGTSGVTSLAAVAPGISEALITTAAGLLAAIPALVAYNYFRNYSRSLSNGLRDFSLDLTNRFEWIVHEHFTVAK